MDLCDIIKETKNHKLLNEKKSWINCILYVLRGEHYWPSIQIKKYNNNNDMLLLHNSYKQLTNRISIYDECRSVILDFSNENVIIHTASIIPERLSLEEYKLKMDSNDECILSFDNTVVYVYYNNNKWYFSTNTCSNIDYSKFNNPTKKYGEMFDEILNSLLNDNSKNIRELFTKYLDENIVYTFGLLHYENTKKFEYTKNIISIDYSILYGPEYKKLIFIDSKQKYKNISIACNSKLKELNLIFQHKYNNIMDALNQLNDIYCLIIKNKNKIYKVSNDDILFQEKTNYGYPNQWRNFLWLYQQNLSYFSINDYIDKYIVNNDENILEASNLIETVMTTIKSILFDLYSKSTVYYPNYNRFKMSKDIDNKFSSIIQYHLAQIRYKQVTIFTNIIITENEIFKYLCYNNPIKNIILLIDHFAKSPIYNMDENTLLCFQKLNILLL